MRLTPPQAAMTPSAGGCAHMLRRGLPGRGEAGLGDEMGPPLRHHPPAHLRRRLPGRPRAGERGRELVVEEPDHIRLGSVDPVDVESGRQGEYDASRVAGGDAGAGGARAGASMRPPQSTQALAPKDVSSAGDAGGPGKRRSRRSPPFAHVVDPALARRLSR